MTYDRLEQAPAWVESVELARLVYNLTSSASDSFQPVDTLRSQLEHSALAVSNAIASGFERTSNDLFASLQRASGATGEVRSMLGLLAKLPTFTSYGAQIDLIRSKTETCSDKLKEWAGTLHHGPTNGHNPSDEEKRRREKRAIFEGLKQLNGS